MRKAKRRYLALKIESDVMITADALMDTVWQAVQKLYGERGASISGLSLMIFEPQEKSAILRASREAVDMVRASIATITKIDGKPSAVHVLAVSGTIKSLRQKAHL